MLKSSRLQDQKHLDAIKGMRCAKCGIQANEVISVVPAHIRRGSDGSMGRKPSDNFALPLCTLCHGIQHQKGEVTFWQESAFGSVDQARIAALNLHETGDYSNPLHLEFGL